VGEVAATKTPCSPQELVEAIAASWPDIAPDAPLTLAVACTLAAQWAIETGEGAACICWNIGNAKWNRDPSVMWTQFTTQEYVNGVLKTISPPEIGCQFMAYPNLQAGVTAWLASLSKRWTLAWAAALKGDPTGFAEGLRNQSPPYYTAPAATYVAGMLRYFTPFMKSLVLPTADTDPPPPSSAPPTPSDPGLT
jgi:hypothetical protein